MTTQEILGPLSDELKLADLLVRIQNLRHFVLSQVLINAKQQLSDYGGKAAKALGLKGWQSASLSLQGQNPRAAGTQHWGSEANLFSSIYPDKKGETNQIKVRSGSIGRHTLKWIELTPDNTVFLPPQMAKIKQATTYSFPSLLTVSAPVHIAKYGHQDNPPLDCIMTHSVGYWVSREPNGPRYNYSTGSFRTWTPNSAELLDITDRLRQLNDVLLYALTQERMANPYAGGLPGQNS